MTKHRWQSIKVEYTIWGQVYFSLWQNGVSIAKVLERESTGFLGLPIGCSSSKLCRMENSLLCNHVLFTVFFAPLCLLVPGFSLLTKVPGMQINSHRTGRPARVGSVNTSSVCSKLLQVSCKAGLCIGEGIYYLSLVSTFFSPSIMAAEFKTQGQGHFLPRVGCSSACLFRALWQILLFHVLTKCSFLK